MKSLRRIPAFPALLACSLFALAATAAAEKAPRALGGLDCSGAVDIACGQTVQGTTVGGTNTAPTYPCLPPEFSDESGPENVYRIVLGATTDLVITLAPLAGDDLDLFLLGSCNENLCVGFSSTFPQPEVVFTCLAAGTYYVVVDGFEGAAGPYALSAACNDCVGSPPNEHCDGAQTLACGAVDVQTNTAGARNNYALTEAGCTGADSDGPDIVYRVVIPNGESVQLQFEEQTYDASVYLVTDCSDIQGSCLTGEDCFPFPCTDHVNYTNNTGSTLEAFLIVDGFNPTDAGLGRLTGTVPCAGACCIGTGCEVSSPVECAARGGVYQGDGTECNGCTIAVVPDSWSRVKSLFR